MSAGVPQGNIPANKSVRRWSYNGVFAAAQTNTVIEAAPGPGHAIRIFGYAINANAAVNIDIEDEDDNMVLGPFYLTAKHVADEGNVVIELPENKALELDSDAAVAHNVTMWGDIVRTQVQPNA